MSDKLYDFVEAHGTKIRWFAVGWFSSVVLDFVLEVIP